MMLLSGDVESGVVEVETDHAASWSTSAGAIPRQRVDAAGELKRSSPLWTDIQSVEVGNPTARPMRARILCVWEGAAMWMASDDGRYLNFRCWHRSDKGSPNLGDREDLNNIDSKRVAALPRLTGGTRHKVSAPGLTFSQVVELDPGKRVWAHMAMSVEIDKDATKAYHQHYPLLRAWRPMRVSWDLLETTA